MLLRPPSSTRTDTLFPASTRFRSCTVCRRTGVCSPPGGWPAPSPSPPTWCCPPPPGTTTMAEMGLDQGIWWAYVLVVVGGLATYFRRALGVALSGRLAASSSFFDWVACVAYALLAGLIARMLLLPSCPPPATTHAHRHPGGLLGPANFLLKR